MTDREKLIALLVEAESLCAAIDCYDGAVCEYAGEINGCTAFRADHLLANGVTIPTRCKDCKWFRPNSTTLGKHCSCSGMVVEDNDFCSCGERRSDD